MIGVIGDDVDVGEKQHRLNSFRWPDSTAGHREQRPSRNSANANASCRSLSDVPTGDWMNVMRATLRSRRLRTPSRELSWANRLPLSSVGVVVIADRGEPVLSVVELAGDHVLDVGVKRSVRAKDELAQYRHQGTVLAGQRG